MIKKILLLGVIIFVVGSFLVLVMPTLKNLKQERNTNTSHQTIAEQNLTGGRYIAIDISIESPCQNMVTEEVLPKCLGATNCDSVCRIEGCAFFGLTYVSSDYSQGHCECNCHEENKIKKALTPG